MAPIIDSQVVQQIHGKETKLTKQPDPVVGGPTSTAEKHIGEQLDGHIISEITVGEKKITDGERIKGGPTSTAQSILARGKSSDVNIEDKSSNGSSNSVDSKPDNNASIFRAIATAFERCKTEIARQLQDLEKAIQQVASEQTHGNSPKIDSKTISVIFAAERDITGNKMPVKGGPTAQAQKHVGEDIDVSNIQAISQGEKSITGNGEVMSDGPTAILEQKLSDCHVCEL